MDVKEKGLVMALVFSSHPGQIGKFENSVGIFDSGMKMGQIVFQLELKMRLCTKQVKYNPTKLCRCVLVFADDIEVCLGLIPWACQTFQSGILASPTRTDLVIHQHQFNISCF